MLLVFCQTTCHNLRDCQRFINLRFSESKFRNERDGAVPRLDPGAVETAATFMGSGVSRLHERRSIKFCVSLWGVVSCEGAATSLIPRVSLSSSSFLSVCARLRLRPSPSSSISVFVCLRRSARWLVQRALAVCPMVYIEGPAYFKFVRYSVKCST